jgi:hypothetical protein
LNKTDNNYNYYIKYKLLIVLIISIIWIDISIAFEDPIPGPRNCFWSRGPASADPYLNLAYPDANVFYWAAVFSIPSDAELTIEGNYPHSRYMSFASYDEKGRPIESLADYLINSKSANPFIPGNKRYENERGYKVTILNEIPNVKRKVGEKVSIDSENKLHAPSYGKGQQAIVYRIYLPDREKEPDGGVQLPTPVLTLSNGKQFKGDSACDLLNASQQLTVSLGALGIPPGQYRKLVTQQDKPETWPAHNPPKWFIQLDRQSLIGMYTGEIDPNAPRSEGGFYPNLDNHYIRTIVNRKHGKVLIIKGKAPVVPKTFDSNELMTSGELRYWSICSNQSFVNTRVNDCLYDQEIPLASDGTYTIAVSREEDRPRNAIKECGFGWLPMAIDGDGMFDEDVTIIQFRHMLAEKSFKNSIQSVLMQKQLEVTMGDYMPKSRYLMTNQVETIFPCLLSKSE